MSNAKLSEIWFQGTFYTFTFDASNDYHADLYADFLRAFQFARSNPIDYPMKNAWAYLGKAFAEGIVEKS
jgi:hypothetical protein